MFKSNYGDLQILTTDKAEIFLITRDRFIPFSTCDEFEPTLFYDGTLEENILGVLTSCTCTKCKTPNILFSLDGSEVVGAESRQMGVESYFTCEAFSECGGCGSYLHSKFHFAEYVYSITFVDVEEQENCESFFIGSLQFVAQQLTSLLAKQYENAKEFDLLFDEKKPNFCRVLVEGKDDKAILESFFSKVGLIENQDYYIFSGYEQGNGFGAVKTAVHILKGLKITLPFIAVVDSDHKVEEHTRLLRGVGASDDEFFVLKKGVIEDYIIDSKAISIITKKSEEDIQKFISDTSFSGKKLLTKIFSHFQLPVPKSEKKKEITEKIDEIPKEIREIIKIVQQKCS